MLQSDLLLMEFSIVLFPAFTAALCAGRPDFKVRTSSSDFTITFEVVVIRNSGDRYMTRLHS